MDHQVDVIPAVAKGLEFDRVVVIGPSAIAAAEPDRRTGLRRLYVVPTRAVSELTMLTELTRLTEPRALSAVRPTDYQTHSRSCLP